MKRTIILLLALVLMAAFAVASEYHGTFYGDLSNGTNVNAANLVGTVPSANLPTVITNGGITRTITASGSLIISNTATFSTMTVTTNMALDFTNVTMWFGSLTGTNAMFLLNKTTGNTNVLLLK